MIARLEEMLEDSAWRYVTLQAWRRASIAARAKTRRYRSAISPVLTSAVAVVNQHACASQRALHHQLLSAA